MRVSLAQAILPMVVALALAGCSTALTRPGQGQGGGPSSPVPSVATAPPAPTATSRAAAGSSTPVSAATSTSANPADAVIRSVIQRANAEQQEAFAAGNPSAMRDTATTLYYDELVQINRQMASDGVLAIKLIKLEWGPITLNSPTVAQATTYETWLTSYADGSTEQSRDRNVYTLVQQQGTWKIQSDVQPDSNLDSSPAPLAPAPFGQVPPGVTVPVAPVSPGQLPPGITVPIDPSLPGQASPGASVAPHPRGVSQNWSGYAATGGTYTGVTGTWTVPRSDGNAGFGSGATWVGIGGVRSRDLIQAGTEEVTSGTGRVHYDAWIETLPQPSHPVPLAVSPGDVVTASIAEQGTDQWLITLTNETTNQRYQTTVSYASSRSSAEWIEEAPSTRRQIVPLDNFGTVRFSNGSAIKDGKTVTIAQAGAQPVTMVDVADQPIATPSALTASGSGFSITRSAASALDPQPGTGIPVLPGRVPRRSVDPIGPSFGDAQ